MVKLQEYKGQFFITIPREYVLDKEWEKGQEIVIGFDANGNLVLRAVKKSVIKMQNNKRPLEISEETKKVLQQARKPEFSEEEIDKGLGYIEKS